MEHVGDGDTNYSWSTWNGTQRIGKKTGTIRNWRKNCGHLDNCIVEISQNTEKSSGDVSSGDLKRLSFTQTSVKVY